MIVINFPLPTPCIWYRLGGGERGGWRGGCGRGEELPAGHAEGGSPPPPTGLGRESLQVSIARDGLATFFKLRDNNNATTC